MSEISVSVTRAQTLAAQLLIRLNQKDGLETSAAIRKVADAGIRAGVSLPTPASRKRTTAWKTQQTRA